MGTKSVLQHTPPDSYTKDSSNSPRELGISADSYTPPTLDLLIPHAHMNPYLQLSPIAPFHSTPTQPH